MAPASKATSAQDKKHTPRDGSIPQEYDTNVTAHYNIVSQGNGTVVVTNNRASSSEHISNVNLIHIENNWQASPKAHKSPEAQLPSQAQNLCLFIEISEDTGLPFPAGFVPPFFGPKLNSPLSSNV